MVTLTLQLQTRLAVPILTAYPPRKIVIFSSDALKADITQHPNQVFFASTTSYSNTTIGGHDAIILDEFIRVTIGSRKLQHWLIEVGNSDAAPVFKIVSGSSRPVPFVVPATGGFSQEVLFAPYSSPYCLPRDTERDGAHTWYSWEEFRRDILAAGKINVTLGAKLPDQTAGLANCTVYLSEEKVGLKLPVMTAGGRQSVIN